MPRSTTWITARWTISGSGNLVKAGSGTIGLTKANSYTGATDITGGVLQIQAPTLSAASAPTPLVWFDPSNPAGAVLNGAAVTQLTNLASMASGNASIESGHAAPTLTVSNSSFNGLPTVNFNGTQALGGFNLSSLNGSSYTIVAVEGKGSNGNIYFLGTNAAAQNQALHFGCRMDTDFTLAQYTNDLDDTSAPSYGGSEVARSWAAVLNTAVGHSVYLNGSVVASNTNTTSNGALVFNHSDPAKLAAAISGSGSLTKLGSGNLSLAGPDSFFGATLVAAGVRTAASTGAFSPNSAVTVSGGTLDASGFAQSIYSLTMGSLGTLNRGGGNPMAVATSASFAGTLDILGGTRGIPSGAGTAVLMSYISDTGVFTQVNGVPNNYHLAYEATSLDLVANTSIWSVATSGSWNDTTKWSTGTAPSGPGQAAVLGAATTASHTISLDNQQTLGVLTFTNSASATAGYTLSTGSAGGLTMDNSGLASQIIVNSGSHGIGAPVEISGGALDITISNSGSLLISGGITDDGGNRSLDLGVLGGDESGTLILSGPDNYTGGTFVEAGTLQIAADGSIPDGSGLAIGTGATLVFNPMVAGASVSSLTGPAKVPEPGTFMLLLAAAVGCAAWARQRRKLPQRVDTVSYSPHYHDHD